MSTPSSELAQSSTAGALAIRPGQTEWSPMQLAALKQMGIGDATPEDQQLFLHHCTRTGLDPFAKQVYMIGRSGDVKRVNDRGQTVTERGTIYTIQTGIDGYRLIGSRAARAAGDVIEHEEPLWRGKPGGDRDEWTDYWPDGAGAPAACKYVIRVNGQRVVATVNFHEYAQYSGKNSLTPIWDRMPANQMAVRAEAQAWRKAYPADFSGMALGTPTDPAHHTVIDAEPATPPPARQQHTTGRGVAGLDAALDRQQPARPTSISKAQIEAVMAGLDALFGDVTEGRASYVQSAVDAPVNSLKELTGEQAEQLLNVIAEHTAQRADAAASSDDPDGDAADAAREREEQERGSTAD